MTLHESPVAGAAFCGVGEGPGLMVVPTWVV
jgi:hypothetical protein